MGGDAFGCDLHRQPRSYTRASGLRTGGVRPHPWPMNLRPQGPSQRFRVAAALFMLGLAQTLRAAPALPKIKVEADGNGFATIPGQPFVPFGVTYYRPGTSWAPQVWKTFDA